MAAKDRTGSLDLNVESLIGRGSILQVVDSASAAEVDGVIEDKLRRALGLVTGLVENEEVKSALGLGQIIALECVEELLDNAVALRRISAGLASAAA